MQLAVEALVRSAAGLSIADEGRVRWQLVCALLADCGCLNPSNGVDRWTSVVVASLGVSKVRNSEAGVMVAVVAITSSIPACHACARLAGQVIAETTARPRIYA